MANYVRNTLRVVDGDPNEVFNALRTERSLIDFQQLIPMPEVIMNSVEQVEWQGMKVKVREAWAAEYWGTLKNACDAVCFQADAIEFDTPWCEPLPIFEALAKRFPNHVMVVIADYLDWGLDEYESYILQDGSVISEGRQKCRYFDEDNHPEEKA